MGGRADGLGLHLIMTGAQQGNDPTTDFRGTGVLGLHCLAYSVRVHRDAVLALARAERDYPWAAASINVVHVLFQKLCSGGAKVDIASLYHSSAELNTPLMTWCCRVSHPRPVEELFVITSALLDAVRHVVVTRGCEC